MQIKRSYYPIELLAKRWSLEIEEVMHLGISGQIEFCALADWEYPKISKILRAQPTTLTSDEVSNIYYAIEPFEFVGQANMSGEGVLKGDECVITYYPGYERLVVGADEVERFEMDSVDTKLKIQETNSSFRPHISKKLSVLIEAANTFWGSADPNDKYTHDTNAKVAAWLMENGFTNKEAAEQGASIIRPDWAAKGRR